MPEKVWQGFVLQSAAVDPAVALVASLILEGYAPREAHRQAAQAIASQRRADVRLSAQLFVAVQDAGEVWIVVTPETGLTDSGYARIFHATRAAVQLPSFRQVIPCYPLAWPGDTIRARQLPDSLPERVRERFLRT